MLVPICPLCCEQFMELRNVSACLCGHAFHHNCIQSFHDLTSRFKGFAGCPSCGGGTDHDIVSGERDSRKSTGHGGVTTVINNTGQSDGSSPSNCENIRKFPPHRQCFVVRIRFIFDPESSHDNQRICDLRTKLCESQKFAADQEARQTEEIKELERKLRSIISLLRTVEQQRDNLKQQMEDSSYIQNKNHSMNHSISNLDCNINNHNISKDVARGSESAAPSRSRLILSSLVHLAAHAVIDYQTSPPLVRRSFHQYHRRSKRPRVIQKEHTLIGDKVPSESTLPLTSSESSLQSFSTDGSLGDVSVPVESTINNPEALDVVGAVPHVRRCRIISLSTIAEEDEDDVDSRKDFACQTEWQASEWDSDGSYEIDWDWDDLEYL